MVASVLFQLSPRDERTKLLKEKLAIIQEAQVATMTSGFAAASSLQLLRRDTLLQNFSFQPQVLSIVGTAPFEGSHVLGLEGTTATCTQYPTHRQDVRIIKSRSRKRPKRLLHPRALRRRVRSYVHNKPGCRCLIVWGLLVSPPPFRGPRMAGSHFPTATSTHPSQHRFPHQEQPLGSTADCGCPAVQRSHSEGPEWSISRGSTAGCFWCWRRQGICVPSSCFLHWISTWWCRTSKWKHRHLYEQPSGPKNGPYPQM